MMSPSPATRTESDTFGPIEVPADRYWGAQTQRSTQNFRIGVERMPHPLVHALGLVKQAAALVNKDLGGLEPGLADGVADAAAAVGGGPSAGMPSRTQLARWWRAATTTSFRWWCGRLAPAHSPT